MKSAMIRMICHLLTVSMLLMPFQSIQAGMIGADQAAVATSAQADRASVLNLINRSDVASQLQTLGLDPQTAKDRVAAMTDNEVSSLAGKLDSLPAGAWSNGWWWAVAIVLAVVIWYNWK